MTRGRVYLFLALANLFWAGNYVFGEMVTREISPISLTFLRWAFAALPLLALAWVVERPDWRVALREWKLHLLQSLLGLTGYTLLLYAGLGLTGAVNAAVLSAVNPATIALGAAIFLRERLTRVQVAGLVIAFAGVTVVLTGGDLGLLVAQGFGAGDLLVIGSVLAWTVYSLIARRLVTPPITATSVQAVFAVVTMLPVVAIAGLSLPSSPAGALGLAYIVLFPSMAGYALWNIGAARVGPSRAGIFLNLLPVFTVLIALAFGATIELPALIGGAVVIVGVYLTLRPPSARRGRDRATSDGASPARLARDPVEPVADERPE
ncbi:DMT family transporter [Agromyces aurantiacus]|uniref:DMT family transporter n=1 Tax=Agromyces aurantiacus TaxID=165814 RepID=A0ABV9RAB4_9MICO|nr:DMT family transporter [Agromyces aurantiacus]MBM7505361.1 drug/metabolite transporter (DMT)-like permease [Agromyces aurantiacus]